MAHVLPVFLKCMVQVLPVVLKCMGGVMVSMLVSSAIDRGIKTPVGSNLDICCFSAKHAALWRKSKNWLARNQNNVSGWTNNNLRNRYVMRIFVYTHSYYRPLSNYFSWISTPLNHFVHQYIIAFSKYSSQKAPRKNWFFIVDSAFFKITLI